MGDKEIKELKNYQIILFFVSVIIAWILAWHFVGSSFSSWDIRGSFGDMFGAINALFSGLAFAGVIIAILLQRQELRLQRKELEQTKEELKGQRTALELQNFNNTFFQLVRFQYNITEGINIEIKGSLGIPLAIYLEPPIFKGRDSFYHLYNHFRDNFYNQIVKLERKNNSIVEIINKSLVEIINKSFIEFFEVYQSDLGHYFRNLYNIFKYIDNSRFSYLEKKFYSNIIRGQLSNYELLLLFYNSQSRYGKNFIKYIETYELFDNMPLDKLIDEETHVSLYDIKAYGNQLEHESIY
jgi:hypothetical protein